MLNYDNIMHCYPSATCSFAILNYDNIMHCHPRSCSRVHKLAFFTYCFATGKVLIHWECLLSSTKSTDPLIDVFSEILSTITKYVINEADSCMVI